VKKLAARFAAKEAFFKALGQGVVGGLKWKDAEVKKVPAANLSSSSGAEHSNSPVTWV
jgi:phosphopantetheinyl transferase (holo-ACP synthase)